MSSHRTKIVLGTILFCAALAPGLAPAREPYAPPVEYRQRMTPVVRESQVAGWLPTYGRYFHELAVSANGAKIGFLVQLASLADKHIYVMNQDGTDLTDLTGGLLPTATASAMHKLEINDSGSRLFFFGVYMQRLFYFETAAATCHLALDANPFGDFRKPYILNAAGTSFTMKYNAGWDPVAQKNQYGIFRSDVGGPPAILLHQDQIPGCLSECLNYNIPAFIGAARTGPRFFLRFDRDYWGAAPSVGLWRGGEAGDPRLLPPAEYDYLWDQQDLPNHVTSADGARALVTHMNAGQPKRLLLLDTTTGAETFITETTDLNAYGDGPALSPDGTVARFACAGHRGTRVNLASMTFRDTLSQHFPESACSRTADGASDPLLGVLPRRFPAFQWHYYTFDLPAGAVELASSTAARQSFRLGDRTWAIQFHAEVDRVMLDHWFVSGEDELPKPLKEIQAETDRLLETWNGQGSALCNTFLDLAAGIAR